MGNQEPSEISMDKRDEEIEATGGRRCRKQRGRLPIEWSIPGSGTQETHLSDSKCYESYPTIEAEPFVQTTLMGCVANCTVARRCNFITFKPMSAISKQGECVPCLRICCSRIFKRRNVVGTCHFTCRCTSFHIDGGCFGSSDDPSCYNTTGDPQTIGFSLGACPFAAEPSGDIISRSFGLFRAMRQDAANALAIAASALTILVAVAGAPFSFLSKVFKL